MANGRCSVADEVYLQFTAVKDLRVQEAYLEGEYGEDILISAKGSNVDFWHWTLGDGLEVTTNEPSGTHRYLYSGHYNGTLLAYNSDGCTATTSFEVNVPDHLFIPSVFTRNQDGINDYFDVQYNGSGEVKVLIYDRWGTSSIHATHLKNHGMVLTCPAERTITELTWEILCSRAWYPFYVDSCHIF